MSALNPRQSVAPEAARPLARPQTCAGCGVTADVVDGVELGGRPYCAPCGGRRLAGPPLRVQLVRAGLGLVAARPDRALGGEAWQAFQAAARSGGARFRGAGVGYAVELDGEERLERVLRALGFAVEVHPLVSAALLARAQARRLALEESDARVVAKRAALRARGLDLYDHQPEGVRFLSGRRSALLLDPMGAGKSVMTALAIPDGAPVVLVAPASMRGVLRADGTALGGWLEELARWRPELRLRALAGRREAFRWPEPGEALVLSYEAQPGEVARGGAVALPSLPARGTCLIADEVQAVKNPRTARARRFTAVAAAVRRLDGRTWGLTGTPLENDPGELAAILRAFDLFAESFEDVATFHRLFNAERVPIHGRGRRSWFAGGSELVWGTPSPEAAERLRRVSLRRRKEEILAFLPPVRHRVVTVRVEDAVRRLADEAVAGLDVAALEEELSSPSWFQARRALAEAKILAVTEHLDELEEAGEVALVFSCHLAPLRAFGARPGWAVFEGATTKKRRAELVAAFQAGELRGLACSILAGGRGLTLTRAAFVDFVDLAWNPAVNEQGVARADRISQTRPVLVTWFVADHPLDEHVLRRTREKAELAAAVVDASAVSTRSA